MECPHHQLIVPIRRSLVEFVTPMTAHLPSGERTGVAFTTVEALEAALPGHPWTSLGECGLRELLLAIGVDHLQVDPPLVVVPARALALTAWPV